MVYIIYYFAVYTEKLVSSVGYILHMLLGYLITCLSAPVYSLTFPGTDQDRYQRPDPGLYYGLFWAGQLGVKFMVLDSA